MPTIDESPAAEVLSSFGKYFNQSMVEAATNPEINDPAAEAAAPEQDATPAKAEAPKKEASEPAKEEPKARTEEETIFQKEEVKPEPEKTSAKDDLEEALKSETKGMTDKAKDKWISLRRSEHAAQKRAKELEAEAARVKALEEKVSQYESAKPNTEELERTKQENADLKAQLAEYEKEVSIARIEATKAYKEQVAKPKSEIADEVTALAKEYEVSPKELMLALNEDNARERNHRLQELAEGFKEADRVELYALGNQFAKIRKTENFLRENAASQREQLTRQEQEEASKLQAHEREAYKDSALRAWSQAQQALDFLRKHDNAPEWNAALDRAQTVSVDFDPHTAGPGVIGELVAKANTVPFILKAVEHYRKAANTAASEFKAEKEKLTSEIGLLTERLAKYEKSQPGAGGSAGEPEPEDDYTEGLSLGQSIARKR